MAERPAPGRRPSETAGPGPGEPASKWIPPSPASRGPRSHRDADFSRAVLDALYRYPKKRRTLAYVLWATTGLMGGHRFYADRPGTGLAMLFTLGGAGLWWLIDVFFVAKMVRSFNLEQEGREATGLPPRSLAFMPPLKGATLPPYPEWVTKRAGRSRLAGDVIVLLVAGSALGAFASSTGNYEPVIAVLALIAITVLGARWDALAHLPILRGFDRWNHRLRLFYFVTDPGGPLRLAFRPLFGAVVAPFRRRARAEAKLYLQLGAWFTIIFTIFDVLESVSIGAGRIDISPGPFLADLFQTFITVYMFAAPIGAILTTHLLLERRDLVLWILSGISVFAIVSGLGGGLL